MTDGNLLASRPSPRPHAWLERRKHPRIEAGDLLPVSSSADDTRNNPPMRQRIGRRLLALLRAPSRPRVAPQAYGARVSAARTERLPRIAERLEAVLAELDALGMWRAATDVSSAIERLRSAGDDRRGA